MNKEEIALWQAELERMKKLNDEIIEEYLKNRKMEFKEAYKKGLKTGKTITNGSYTLKITKEGLQATDVMGWNTPPSIIEIFLNSFEDNWEIAMEE